MTLAQNIRDSSKWLIGSNVMSQALQFVFGIVLARLLVPADFGMIVTIQIFTGVIGLIASGGMGQALVRAKSVREHDFQVVFTLQLLICLTVFAGLYLVAPAFARWFSEPLYEILLRVSAINFLIRPFLSIHTSWLNREMRFKDISIQNFIAGVVSGLSSIAMAVSGLGVWSLVLGGLVGSIASLLMVVRITPLRARPRFDRAVARTHGNYGIKITLKDLAVYFRKQTSNLIITKLAGPAMVGLFNKGYSMATLPLTTISGPVFQPVFRSMSAEQDNPDRIKYLFFRMISLLLLYTLPLYIGLTWLAEPFIIVVYGEHWREAVPVLQILAPLGLLYCVGHPCGAVLAATNRVGREIVVQILSWVIVAAGCFIGLRWGLSGAAFGIVLSQVYATIHLYYLATRCFSSSARDLFAAIAPALALNTIMLATLGVVEWLVPDSFKNEWQALYLLSATAAAALTYLLGLLLLPLGSLTSEAGRIRGILRLAR